jgi:hypothetical protein
MAFDFDDVIEIDCDLAETLIDLIEHPEVGQRDTPFG